jgi:alkylated DNA repair dioxygenase AlkB
MGEACVPEPSGSSSDSSACVRYPAYRRAYARRPRRVKRRWPLDPGREQRVGPILSSLLHMRRQLDIFGDERDSPIPAGGRLPDGFRYQTDLIPSDAESALLEHIRPLPFRDFEFHGYTGKRRVVSFGWHYDFGARSLRKADDMPDFLIELRAAAAQFAGMHPEALQHVLVTEYGPGAAIGWHRDKAVFGEVVGISLLSPCTFRLRRKSGDSWERVNLIAEPRSAYLLSGAARREWEHSIPAVDALRYSVTYRNLRE